MTGTIIPLRPKGDDQSPLARLDLIAAELMAEGRAGTLSAARIKALLTTLHAHRNDLVAVIADLHTRGLTGDAQFDAVNSDLGATASQVLAQLDRIIRNADAVAGASTHHLQAPA